jgi:hypothetical protein
MRNKGRKAGNWQGNSGDQPRSVSNLTGNLADKGRKAAKVPRFVRQVRGKKTDYGFYFCLSPKSNDDFPAIMTEKSSKPSMS